MKPFLFITTILVLVVASACTSRQISSTAEPIVIQSDTTVPSTVAVPLTEIPSNLPTLESSSTDEVMMADNGKTLNMNVGDSFLLHLDGDFYDWAVDVDNQNILSRKINVTVINGAQGIYEAHVPGKAILSASGNPKCLNSRPACLAPSVLFTITIIVK